MENRNGTAGIKLLVAGDANTGKSCLLRRFVYGDFTDAYKRTVGAEFLEKDLVIDNVGTTVRLMLWDTAGSDVFNALTQSYYHGAGAAILAFSTVDRASFNNVEGWKQRVESVCGPITIILCQTKFDLFLQSAVGNEEAEQLAMRLKVPLFRTSTKDDFNITPLFQFTAQRCADLWLTARPPPQQLGAPGPSPSLPLYPSTTTLTMASAVAPSLAFAPPSATVATTSVPAALQATDRTSTTSADKAPERGDTKRKKKKLKKKSSCVLM